MDIDENNTEDQDKNISPDNTSENISELEEDKEKIKEQLYQEYRSLFKQFSGTPDEMNPDMISGNKKLIQCRHEIIFHINARVMEEDELGNHVATTAICIKNYHIPVPADKEYNVYMDAFFKHLETCIAQSAQYSKDKENNNG